MTPMSESILYTSLKRGIYGNDGCTGSPQFIGITDLYSVWIYVSVFIVLLLQVSALSIYIVKK